MNEHQARQQQMASQRRQFLQAVAQGSLGVVDRFGNRLEAGDSALFHNTTDMVGEVVSVTPVMDPNAPPGLMDMVLLIRTSVRVAAGQPSPLLLTLRKAQPHQTAPGSNGDGRMSDPGLPVEVQPAAPPAAPTLVLTDGPKPDDDDVF